MLVSSGVHWQPFRCGCSEAQLLPAAVLLLPCILLLVQAQGLPFYGLGPPVRSRPSCCSEGALRELPPVASSAEYVMSPAELAARRDLRGPDYLICRWVSCEGGRQRWVTSADLAGGL